MTLQQDIANDGADFDFVETVTFTPQQGSPVSGVTALRQVASLLKLNALGLEPKAITFNLWVSTLNGAIPANGDAIQDASGQKYTIVYNDLETLATRYCCYCYAQVG